jgi:integrase/recombinase XerD
MTAPVPVVVNPTGVQVMTPTRPVGAEFLDSLQCENTRDAYRVDLRSWFHWCNVHQVDPLQATRANLRAWQIQEEQEKAPATVARRTATVRSFYRYLVQEDLLQRNPAEHLQTPKVSPDTHTSPLTPQQTARLLEVAKAHSATARRLVALLLGCALRVSEALQVTTEDVTTRDEHRVLKVVGKGSRLRLVPLSPLVLELLAPFPDSGPLITGPRGGPLDRRNAARLLRTLEPLALIPPKQLTPHVLRHTAATLSLDSGAPVQKVADLLGHATPSTTMRYVQSREKLSGSAAYLLGSVLGGATVFGSDC